MRGCETIVALSSGRPPCGIAVVRVSGPAACAVAEAFGAHDLPPRRAVLRRLTAGDGSVLDSALCLAFPSPHSVTGEDVVEFHLHGSLAVVERCLADAAALPGVRLAQPGEFTLRAVLAGRMGLPEAEALADLIDARTEAERRRAARLADGALAHRLADWRARLIAGLAEVEAQIDFADEGDVAQHTPTADLGRLRTEISAALAGAVDADKLTDGFRVALIGPPNAGKSSLFNALVGQERAIVSPEPGTTRDVLEAVLDLGGYRVVLLDTAGQRAGAGAVEVEGIRRARAAAASADYVVAVTSPDTDPLPDQADLVLAHKAALGMSPRRGAHLATDVADCASLDRLAATIANAAQAGLATSEAALVTRQRQRQHLTAIVAAVDAAERDARLEMHAEHLRDAVTEMARLTGEIDVERILDDVFGRFCIGK